MKRLTKRDKYGKPDTQKRLNVMFLDEAGRNTMDEILDRLASYENLELTPEQIREIDRLYSGKCREVAEYQKKLEDGRMIELPCKIGDVVYIIGKCKDFPSKLDGTMYDMDGGFGTATGYYCPYEMNNECPFDDCCDCSEVENELGIFQDTVCHICIEEEKTWVICENSNGWEFSDFGKTIFISMEAAEQALSKMKGE